MSQRRLYLLGAHRVEVDAEEIPRFRSQRTVAMLGYLVTAGVPVPRTRLTALFWPDEEAAKGRSNLRRELYNLNQVVADSWQIDSQSVQFVAAPGTLVDVQEVRRLEQAGQWAAAAEWLGGEFLEGIELEENLDFESWLASERERCRQRAENVLLKAAAGAWQAGEGQESQRRLTRLVQMMPWQEEGHRQLMLLYARSGQFAAALRQYEQCRQSLESELAVPPAAATDALYERIKLAASLPQAELPPEPTPFIGRHQEIGLLKQQLLDPACRLLTITGLGGIGKSRLALQAARSVAGNGQRHFLHGTVFVSLAGKSAEEVAAAVAGAVGISFHGREQAEAQLLNQLRHREMLLLLDNYEQLLPDTALLEQILAGAPDVKLLITSRQRLRLQEEWAFALAGLPYPPEGSGVEDEAALPSYPSVRLFAEAATRVRRSFSLAQHGRAVGQICRLTEGMPLALLLAAPWVETMSPPEIAAEIGNSLDLLSTSYRNLPPRQRSVRAVFRATLAQLGAREQELLAALSVFHGGFTKTAAQEVTGSTSADLDRFVNRSLLVRSADGRYAFHELLRQFSAEQLALSGEAQRLVHGRHSSHYLQLLSASEEALYGTDVKRVLQELTPERSNVTTAWRWAVAHLTEAHVANLDRGALGLGRFFHLLGPLQEGRQLLQLAVDRVRSMASSGTSESIKAVLARLLLEWSRFLINERSFEKMAAAAGEAVTLAQESGELELEVLGYFLWGEALYNLHHDDSARSHLELAAALAEQRQMPHERADSLRMLGMLALIRKHDFPGGVAYMEHSLKISQESGDARLEAAALNSLAIAYIERDYSRAMVYFQTAAAIYHRLQDTWGEGIALVNLGHVAAYIGDYALAQEYHQKTVALDRSLGDRQGEGVALVNLCLAAHMQGNNDRALRLAGEALAVAAELNDGYVAAYARMFSGHAHLALGRPDQAMNLYQQALTHWRTKDEEALTLETLAAIARVWLEKGEHDKARLCVDQIVPALDLSRMGRAEDQMRIYLTCIQVLAADDNPRAWSLLEEAHAYLQQKATQISDAASREAFLQNVPSRRAVLEAYESRQSSGVIR